MKVLRKIRQALLEADVALPVAKEVNKNIKPSSDWSGNY